MSQAKLRMVKKKKQKSAHAGARKGESSPIDSHHRSPHFGIDPNHPNATAASLSHCELRNWKAFGVSGKHFHNPPALWNLPVKSRLPKWQVRYESLGTDVSNRFPNWTPFQTVRSLMEMHSTVVATVQGPVRSENGGSIGGQATAQQHNSHKVFDLTKRKVMLTGFGFTWLPPQTFGIVKNMSQIPTNNAGFLTSWPAILPPSHVCMSFAPRFHYSLVIGPIKLAFICHGWLAMSVDRPQDTGIIWHG